MRVRFNAKMRRDLIRQQGGKSRYLDALDAVGMEAQNEPRPGRLNVRFRLREDDPWSYRTYSWRDLEVIV